MQGTSQPHMFNPSAIITGTPSGDGETIQSRFGELSVDLSKALEFPRGLLGIPDKFNYVLTRFPGEKMPQFTLLQSLDDARLSFITLPLDIDNPIVARADIVSACKDLEIDEAQVAALLIVSVHRYPDQVRLSVNARAPLLIDAARRIGAQHVFQQDHYKVQHMLG